MRKQKRPVGRPPVEPGEKRVKVNYTLTNGHYQYFRHFTTIHGCSASRMIDFFIDKVIMEGDYGEDIVDAAIEYSKIKAYHL